MAAADAAIVGRAVDGMLLVVQPAKNHRRMVIRSAESLLSLQVNLLGIVANRVGEESGSGYYGYGSYGYGYGYGYGEAGYGEEEEETPAESTSNSESESEFVPPSEPRVRRASSTSVRSSSSSGGKRPRRAA